MMTSTGVYLSGSHAIRTPPRVPVASSVLYSVNLVPHTSLAIIWFIVAILVSCKHIMSGFSNKIVCLIAILFSLSLMPRTFHDINFIVVL